MTDIAVEQISAIACNFPITDRRTTFATVLWICIGTVSGPLQYSADAHS